MEGVHTHAEHAAPRLLAFLLTLAAVLVTMSVAADVSLARDGEEGDGKGGSGAGAVFSMTNESSQNAVMAYERGSDGRLRDPRRFSTGGTGTGTPEDSSDGLVLADRRGEVSPINLREGGRFLLATNAGSDTVSVFRVRGSGLELVDVEASGGDRPTSVTVSRGVVCVMNAGGAMCTGTTPEQNLSGFRIDNDGELEPIPGSTRPLTGQTASGCTQASFDKRYAYTASFGDNGSISTYRVSPNGALTLIDPGEEDSLGAGASDLALSRNSRYLYAKNSLEASVTVFRIGSDGDLTRIQTVEDGAGAPGSIGLAAE